MVIDSSAIIAIMLRETAADRLMTAIEQSSVRLISVGSVLETTFVLLGRHGELGEVQLDSFLRSLHADIVEFDADQLIIARDAARTFGRGRHKAALNFGDCFGYALAVARGEPLLFVGEDFGWTDVEAVKWRGNAFRSIG